MTVLVLQAELDAYDRLLSQKELQKGVADSNTIVSQRILQQQSTLPVYNTKLTLITFDSFSCCVVVYF